MPREKRKRFWYAFCFFHSLEVILLFVFIGAFLKIYFLFFVSIGFLSHILLDAAQMIHRGDNPFIVLSVSYKLFEMKTKKNFETKVK
ncbi:MAG: hypothetical protein Q8N55_04540 [bacterium]|nr:hypothetical protein [bacterium]